MKTVAYAARPARGPAMLAYVLRDCEHCEALASVLARVEPQLPAGMGLHLIDVADGATHVRSVPLVELVTPTGNVYPVPRANYTEPELAALARLVAQNKVPRAWKRALPQHIAASTAAQRSRAALAAAARRITSE